MESSSHLLRSRNDAFRGGQTRSPSLLPSDTSTSSCRSSLEGLEGNEESQEALGHQGPRWASDFFIEEQPYWLEDLLNEPDTQVHRSHRRSASDTFAYLGAAVEGLDIREHTNPKDLDSASVQYSNVAVSRLAEKHEKNEGSSQNLEGSVEVVSTTSSPAKHPASKTDTKRAKQQSAHRSRVRKLQYISQLETTIQLLQVQGSEISAELEFLDRQNLILSLENKALKQRLDSIVQEQLIKQLEQDMLARELGRLQNLYQRERSKYLKNHQQQQSKMKQKHGQ